MDRTHQGVRVLEKEEPLEAPLPELLGHPFPEEEVVHVAVAVGLGLQGERIAGGQHQARRAVSEGGNLPRQRDESRSRQTQIGVGRDEAEQATKGFAGWEVRRKYISEAKRRSPS